MNQKTKCRICGGTGKVNCTTCGQKGVVITHIRTTSFLIIRINNCSKCSGTGELNCKFCRGLGWKTTF